MVAEQVITPACQLYASVQLNGVGAAAWPAGQLRRRDQLRIGLPNC